MGSPSAPCIASSPTEARHSSGTCFAPRVDRFRELLSQARWSTVSIAELALDCGFADAAHASRTFRAYFQATPRDYRAAALCDREDLRKR
ncbi:MAG: helix-turn-helix domain-containing protein [Sphingomonadales bacterium]|nr:helix-turn-helix domain-containing protein [Sphingomonadales bacterium]